MAWGYGVYGFTMVAMMVWDRDDVFQSHGPRGDGLGNIFIICAQWIVQKVDLGTWLISLHLVYFLRPPLQTLW